jgi:1,4-alpha-glucan branching enzyme
MYQNGHSSNGYSNRYSAKKNSKPVNFICRAPEAEEVTLAGDFNKWNPRTHKMIKQPDGSWSTQVDLSHGHHRYVYYADGEPLLDPKAQGVARNEKNERVSIIAVS